MEIILFILLAMLGICGMFITTNTSIGNKTGLIQSPWRDEYLKQRFDYKELQRVLEIGLSNLTGQVQEHIKLPFAFKWRVYFLGPNSARVLTDTLLMASYYLKKFTVRDIPIPIDTETSNEIHSVLNMVMAYDAIFFRLLNKPDRSSREALTLRFLLLRELCRLNKVHPIEWMFVEPIIRNLYRDDPKSYHDKLAPGVYSLVEIMHKELRHFGVERIRKGLAIAIKAVLFTHPVYIGELRNTQLRKSAVLKNQTFLETSLPKWFFRSVRHGKILEAVPYEEKDLKPFSFDCGRYYIMPILDHGKAYAWLPGDLHGLLFQMHAHKVDLDLWFLDYFSKNNTRYMIVDTINPSLSFVQRHFDLKQESWDQTTHHFHQTFLRYMDRFFNERVLIDG